MKKIKEDIFSGKITIFKLMDFYSGKVKNEEISFITSKDIDFVLKCINDLKGNFDRSNKVIDIHTAHEKGRKLWEKLCSLALFEIDRTSKGNSTLFKYLDEATKFEDLLYGLEEYYRDHTLHSLWVYFLGEYLMHKHFENLQGDDFNWYIINDIKKEEDNFDYPDEYVSFSRYEYENKYKRIINRKKDSIWCIIALCHDLGYSLEKLEKLNLRVEEVLKYFTIKKNENVGYTINIEQQYLVNQLLELVSMEVHIIPSDEYGDYFRSPDYKDADKESKDSLDEFLLPIQNPKPNKEDFNKIKELRKNILVQNINELILTKCYRDDSTYWRLCQSLEKKKHGLLSSYLLFKVIGLFAESSIMGPGDEWGLSEDEAIENIINGNILFAIAQHTFEFADLHELNSLSDILVLVDDIEEFSRFGRPLQSRKYDHTIAEVEIIMIPPKPKPTDKIDIEIIYYVNDDFNEEKFNNFFHRKAEQLCRIYSLGEEQGDYCKIKSIRLTAKSKKQKDLMFTLTEDIDEIKGQLPNHINFPEGEYKMKCIDDKLYINDEDKGVTDDILLIDWLK